MVSVPNGHLSYPYRAIPNGQVGLLVQLRREFGTGANRTWDALVVGVDAAGNLTGSEPLGDDWGDLVVGDNGLVLATSKMNYWTEPGYGGVPKQHVAMIEPITPEGNRAAWPQFYPPTGPCGWIWDGVGQQWTYNGDCDQEVVSITSVVALGGGKTIVSLSNGQVFGPDPAFEHLQLSTVVPPWDGTYLGAGAAGLTNLALTTATEVWPFGPIWPDGGGGPDNAFAADPPSPLRLLGEGDDHMNADLALLKDALDRDQHGVRKPGASTLLSRDAEGYVRIAASIPTFKSYGDIATMMGDLVELLGKKKLTLALGKTAELLLVPWGGARTLERGDTARSAPGRKECSWPCVLVNPEDLANNDLFTGIAYQLFYEGQD